MFSLIIAEDELATRKGLVNTIKWNELGFKVDGEFSDGKELLEYLKNNIPDVILTDIKMRHVSGLDIAHFVAEHKLPTMVVFLSGHREFSFAQQAIEYHVVHYLLKPVSIPKLKEVFRKLYQDLSKQELMQDTMQNREAYYNRLVNYERQQFITDVCLGNLNNPKEMEKRLHLIDSEKHGGKKTRLFLVQTKVYNDIQYTSFLDNYGLQEMEEQLISMLESVDHRLEYYPIKWDNEKKGELSIRGVFWEKENAVLSADNQLDIRQVIDCINQTVYNLTYIQTISTVLSEMHSPEELFFLSEQAEVASIEKRKTSGFEHVIDYIREHYREDITLSSIAENVFLNPAYISRLIKEQTGKKYTDLIVELRMEKAVELLKNTDMYVYEIAENVGYQNLKYFYKVFKRVKGNSPNDYRPN